jgi:processive 1,2-diacylglycerol beta-glucosyltransferase
VFDGATNESLGTITEGQLALLSALLERESLNDDDFYINHDTIALLRERGADDDLLALLEQAVAERGEADLRWSRQ